MELGEYPFSKRYGWVQDKFGVSWQLMLTDPAGEPRPFLIPSFMFANDNVNRAAEALELLHRDIRPREDRQRCALSAGAG